MGLTTGVENHNWKGGKPRHNDIQCHHIVPYRVTKDNTEPNLITLCTSCHKKEETKYYKKLGKDVI